MTGQAILDQPRPASPLRYRLLSGLDQIKQALLQPFMTNNATKFLHLRILLCVAWLNIV